MPLHGHITSSKTRVMNKYSRYNSLTWHISGTTAYARLICGFSDDKGRCRSLPDYVQVMSYRVFWHKANTWIKADLFAPMNTYLWNLKPYTTICIQKYLKMQSANVGHLLRPQCVNKRFHISTASSIRPKFLEPNHFQKKHRRSLFSHNTTTCFHRCTMIKNMCKLILLVIEQKSVSK